MLMPAMRSADGPSRTLENTFTDSSISLQGAASQRTARILLNMDVAFIALMRYEYVNVFTQQP